MGAGSRRMAPHHAQSGRIIFPSWETRDSLFFTARLFDFYRTAESFLPRGGLIFLCGLDWFFARGPLLSAVYRATFNATE